MNKLFHKKASPSRCESESDILIEERLNSPTVHVSEH